ncbi:MAG TPA: 50S ribosomal protein L11 methyltransferase [Xanthobacteraceae bacterium]|jgi:ribosomal protein L11 methyltransferase|nr:50S ribosomal protein L11 methyltransferase [Xanthobacteraceae bacterium]
MSDTMPSADATLCARVVTDEATARRLLDALAEALDPEQAVVSISEERGGGWAVALYFREAPNEAALRALVALGSDTETGNALAFETIGATDWVKASLAGLKPVEAGRFVVHGAHDRARVLANRIGIEIEAALAFGTGHHGTTRGCLLAFNQFLKQRLQRKGAKARVLDLGTGSGVLAIAAARVLRTRVMASDIDGRAVMAARGNAGLNRAASFIEVIRVAGCEAHGLRLGAPYDLIFANILLAPLKRMAHPIARLTQAGGRVILSGLLIAQENGALAAYRAQGLSLERRVVLDGWVTLVMRRGVAAHKRRT